MEQNRISSSQGTQAQTVRARQQGSDPANAAAAPGDFLALLSALDAMPVQPSADLGVADAGRVLVDIDGGASLDASADAAGLMAFQGLFAPDTRGLQDPSMGTGDALFARQGALVGDNGVPLGLVAETAGLDGAADVRPFGLASRLSATGRTFLRAQAPAVGPHPALQDANSLAEGTSGKSVGSITFQNLAPGQVVARSPDAGGMASDGLTKSGAGQAGMELDSTAGEQNPPGATPSGSFAVPRGAEFLGGSQAQSHGQHGSGNLAEGTYASGSGDVSGSESTAQSFDLSHTGAEDVVAEQVAYWVNQKTQNAELTLTRDGQPVEVSVTLSGNEAHVSFRSDQSETRELLDQSSAQLSDLLRSEGLVLSGMTVGASSHRGDGTGSPGHRGSREGPRHTQVISLADAERGDRPRPGIVGERSVDIFV